MYSALGNESAFRDGLFSQAAPGQGFQRSVREFGDGSLGQAYRDGSLGEAMRNDAAWHDGSLGATTRLLHPPQSMLMRRMMRPFQSMRGLGALATPVIAPPAPLTPLQRKRLLEAARRAPLTTAQVRAMRGYGADAITPMQEVASEGPNWPLIIGGGAAIAVAAIVMMSGKKKR